MCVCVCVCVCVAALNMSVAPDRLRGPCRSWIQCVVVVVKVLTAVGRQTAAGKA